MGPRLIWVVKVIYSKQILSTCKTFISKNTTTLFFVNLIVTFRVYTFFLGFLYPA